MADNLTKMVGRGPQKERMSLISFIWGNEDHLALQMHGQNIEGIIRERSHYSRQSIARHLPTLQTEGKVERKKYKKRDFKITDGMLNAIEVWLEEKKHLTIKMIKNLIQETWNVQVSLTTIKTRMKEFGIKCRAKRKVPFMTPDHIVERLNFESNNINVIDWPANSPDLNIIEHVWAILKPKVERAEPKTVHQLEQAITTEWFNIQPSVIHNLYDTIGERIEKCIQSAGGRFNL